MNKLSIFQILLVSVTISLVACQSGSSGTSNPTPTPTPVMNLYVDLLSYTPPANSKAVGDENLIQSQQSMKLAESLSISNISVDFYSDSQCKSPITVVSMSGKATLLSGTYTTTTDSNLSLCSIFQFDGNTGCVYAYAYSRSLNFVVTPVNGSPITGACMTNPVISGERIGYYNLEQSWARNCNVLYNCGFSESYTMILN